MGAALHTCPQEAPVKEDGIAQCLVSGSFVAFSGAACLDGGAACGGLARDRAVTWRKAKGTGGTGWHLVGVSGVWLAPISRLRNGGR